MRAPSVAPCGAVPWVPSNEVRRGNGIGETHEEGGKLHLIIFLDMPACPERGGALNELRLLIKRAVRKSDGSDTVIRRLGCFNTI